MEVYKCHLTLIKNTCDEKHRSAHETLHPSRADGGLKPVDSPCKDSSLKLNCSATLLEYFALPCFAAPR